MMLTAVDENRTLAGARLLARALRARRILSDARFATLETRIPAPSPISPAAQNIWVSLDAKESGSGGLSGSLKGFVPRSTSSGVACAHNRYQATPPPILAAPTASSASQRRRERENVDAAPIHMPSVIPTEMLPGSAIAKASAFFFLPSSTAAKLLRSFSA